MACQFRTAVPKELSSPSGGNERSADELLTAAGWPGSAETVLVVGHQPTLGIVAARLLCGSDQAWAIKKGAVWWIERRERDGFVDVTLIAVQGAGKA